MATKPNFRSNAVSKVDLSSTLQRGAVNRIPEPIPPLQLQPSPVESLPAPTVSRRTVDSRKRKLAHMKTLLEYEEKKEITGFLDDIGDVLGHSVQLSIFNRGLLLATLANKEAFIAAAEKFRGLKRPSNGDVEAFREYEAQLGQMILTALDFTGVARARNR